MPALPLPDRLEGVYMPYARVGEYVAIFSAVAIVAVGYILDKKAC